MKPSFADYVTEEQMLELERLIPLNEPTRPVSYGERVCYEAAFRQHLVPAFRTYLGELIKRGEIAPIDAVDGEDIAVAHAWNRIANEEPQDADWTIVTMVLLGPLASTAKLTSIKTIEAPRASQTFQAELVRLVDLGCPIAVPVGTLKSGEPVRLCGHHWLLRAVAFCKGGAIDLRQIKRRQNAT